MSRRKGLLVDTNIWIYLENRDSYIIDVLHELNKSHYFLFSPTIFKEVSVGSADIESVKKLFDILNGQLVLETTNVMYLAGKKYEQYIRDFKKDREMSLVENMVKKSKSMPNDCVIGATASFYELILLSNNVKDFRLYFPEVELINPFNI